MTTIAFATSRALKDLNDDDRLAAAALTRRGVKVVPAIWNDPKVDWSSFDRVVVRTPWDYHEHAADFLARLGLDLGSEARELAKELENHRLAVSNDEDTVFVYAATRDAEGTRAALARFRRSVARLQRDGHLSAETARALRIGSSIAP